MTKDQKETAVVACSIATVAILAYGLGKATSAIQTHFYNCKFQKAMDKKNAQKNI